MRELYIGLMSGTSMDALDAVLVDFATGVQLVNQVTLPIPTLLQQQSRALNHHSDSDLEKCLVLDRQWGYLFADAVVKLLEKSATSAQDVIAIGSHGQTVRHAPSEQYAYTLQIGDPNTIAEITGIDVVADFRRRDIAAGGQGAPLAPAFHQAIFASAKENRAVVNIGGMANITQLFGKQTIGFDSGPGNVLMDYWINKHQNQPFDRNGLWAASGNVLPKLLKKMLEDSYFAMLPPKSTGREQFDSPWLEQFNLDNERPQDVQATLAELTARSICDVISAEAHAIYVCGGGAFNRYLLQRIQALSQKKVTTTEKLGVPPAYLEAMAFAFFARQTINHKAGNIPSVTGAKGERILGGIYQA